MPPLSGARSSLHRSLGRALAAIVIAGVGMAGLFLSISLPSLYSDAVPWVFIVTFGLFLGAGVIAWWRRPTNGMGALLVFASFCVYAGSLGDARPPLLQAIGAVFATTILAATVHLLRAFPSGRLQGRASRFTVLAAYLVAPVLHAPSYLAVAGPLGPPLLNAPWLAAIGRPVESIAGVAVMVATSVIMIVRLRRAGSQHRRVLLPLFGYGIISILLVSTIPSIFRTFGLSDLARLFLQLGLIAGIPIAFAVAILKGGFAGTRALEELATWIGTGPLGGDAIERELADVLGDDSVRLAYRLGDGTELVGADGVPVASLAPPDDRAMVEITLGGETIAEIFYDPRLVDGEAEVRRAAGVVAIAVERERLLAQLRAIENRLRRSRRHIVAASEDERRRIARDFHDGIQVQLVLLAVDAQQLAMAAPVDSAERDGILRLRLAIDQASDELRALVHTVMPATLVERGLATAIEDLADRMPMPTTTEIDPLARRLPTTVESTAYFVVAEVLTNTVKYAHAHRATVHLTVSQGVLRIDVSDDGIGGAAPRDGSGLDGIADRVDALDGHFDLDSPPGGGTVIRVQLPCGS